LHRGIGFRLCLSFDEVDPTRLNGRQEGKNLGHERDHRLINVAVGEQNYQSDVAPSEVLLMTEVLVAGQQTIELSFRYAKKIAVPGFFLTHVPRGCNLVVGQKPFKTPVQIVIEQKSQRQGVLSGRMSNKD